MSEIRQIVCLQNGFQLNLEYFRHYRAAITYQWTSGSPEFGDQFSPAFEQLLCDAGDAQRSSICTAGSAVEEIHDEAELCKRTAAAIADGKVVRWFRGGWNWVSARLATAQSSAIRAART